MKALGLLFPAGLTITLALLFPFQNHLGVYDVRDLIYLEDQRVDIRLATEVDVFISGSELVEQMRFLVQGLSEEHPTRIATLIDNKLVVVGTLPQHVAIRILLEGRHVRNLVIQSIGRPILSAKITLCAKLFGIIRG